MRELKEELWVVWDYPEHPYVTVYQTTPFKLFCITTLKELEELAFGC
jgi:hypothetical protein